MVSVALQRHRFWSSVSMTGAQGVRSQRQEVRLVK